MFKLIKLTKITDDGCFALKMKSIQYIGTKLSLKQ